MDRVWALYWRSAEQQHWSLDGQPFTDPQAAERFKEKIVGTRRGRSTVAEAMVLEYPSGRDVRSMIVVGREGEAVPSAASSEIRAVPGQTKSGSSSFRKGGG
jgi:hypothetical protein